MEDHADLRRPSDQPRLLVGQLLRELDRLEREGDVAEEPDLYRAYLHYALTLAWEGASRGELSAPRGILDHLLAAQPWADAFLPEALRPREQAAMEVDFAIRSLYLTCEVLEDRQVEVRLAESRSGLEREILRVLAENRAKYLRRRDVHDRLDPKIRPTPARVGQILSNLYLDDLLKRVHSRAQGNSSTSFYALSPRGVEICRELGILPREEASEAQGNVESREGSLEIKIIQQLAEVALDPGQSPDHRGVAVGMLANCHAPADQILGALEVTITGKENERTVELLKEAYVQIATAKSKLEVEGGGEVCSEEHPGAPDRGVVRLGGERRDTRSGSTRAAISKGVVAVMTRRNPISSSPASEAILSAREEAVVEALELVEA